MPHFWNNKWVVTKEELVPAHFNSDKHLNQTIFRYKDLPYGIKRVQRGGNGRQMLIDFDSLPDEIRNAIGDPRKVDHLCEHYYELDLEAVNYYRDYRFEDGSPLSFEHQEQYIINASVIKTAFRLKAKRLAEWKSKNRKSTSGLMRMVASDIRSFNITLQKKHDIQHTLPTNERRFKQCLNEFETKGFESLISGKHRNANARKVGKIKEGAKVVTLPSRRVDVSEWHARTLMYLYMQPGKGNKFDYEEIYKRYCMACGKDDQEPVSLRTVKNFLSSPEIQMVAMRERNGWAAFDKKLPHVKRDRPQFSLSKGGYDGFSVDFYTDVDNTRVMLTMVAVFDYHTGAITGYDIGITESGEMVRNMYRNHLNRWEGRAYLEIESDRASGNLARDTQAIFSGCGTKITMPAPNDPRGKAPNPKARYVERLLQELNRLTQSVQGWKGTNITSQRDQTRKSNPDYGQPAQQSLAHGIKLISQLVAVYNAEVREELGGLSRIEAFKQHLNPQAPCIPAHTRAMLLNQHTTTTVRQGVITIEVNRRKYEFEYPDHWQHLHLFGPKDKVRVYFDETDMSTVEVFGFKDKDDTRTDYWLASLGRLQRAQEAIAERTEEDNHRIGRQKSRREKMQQEFTRKSLEVEATTYGMELPQGISLDEAERIVAGWRMQHQEEIILPFEERHAEALETEEAQQQMAYYEERLLVHAGHKVPDTKPKSTLSRRELARTIYKNNQK